MNKKFLKLISIFFLFSLVIFSFLNKKVKANENIDLKYNLVILVYFNDEDDHINDIEYASQTRREIIDNTYNKSNYSIYEYIKSVSNNKYNMKTVYLFSDTTEYSSFKLDNPRGYYCPKNEENSIGYDSYQETARSNEFVQDWTSKVQQALDKNILPCDFNDRTKTIPYEYLDKDDDGIADRITLILSPQTQLNFTSPRRSPLYPCSYWTYNDMSLKFRSGTKTIVSSVYSQNTSNFSSLYYDSNEPNVPFLSNGSGTHELIHTFGFKDLYEEYPKYYPVGNISLMSNLANPIPQFLTSKEREVMGSLNEENVKNINSSGTYTLDAVSDNDGKNIVCYKIKIKDFPNKWLYLEYRYFDDVSYNRFDAYNKNVYSMLYGTSAKGVLSKTGVVAYIVDDDALFPTNSHGRYEYFGIDVIGGSLKSRSDAPFVQGDEISVSAYNKDKGKYLNTGINILIDKLEGTKATFTINADFLNTVTDNEKPTISLVGGSTYSNTSYIEPGIIYKDNSTGTLEFTIENPSTELNLKIEYYYNGEKVSEIKNIGNYQVKYIVTDKSLNEEVAIRNVTIIDNEKPTISLVGGSTYSNTSYIEPGIIYKDNSTGTLEFTIENPSTELNLKIEYYYNGEKVSEIKNIGNYQVKYIVTDKSLNEEVAIRNVTIIDNEKPTISLVGGSTYSNTSYIEPGIIYKDNSTGTLEFTIENPSTELNLKIEYYYNGEKVSEIKNIGNYQVKYIVTDKSLNEEVAIRNVTIIDNEKPTISLVGGSTYSNTSYIELGIIYKDNSTGTLEFTIENPSTELTLKIEYYYNGEKVSEIKNIGNYQVKYIVTDKSLNEEVAIRNVTIIDNEKPTISLVGGSTYSNTSYIELGIIYKDNSTGTLEFTIENPSTELTLKIEYYYNGEKVSEIKNIGNYQVKYIVTDKSLNEEVAIRNVTIIDNEKPTISLVGDVNYLGFSYKEYGFKFSDNSTGDEVFSNLCYPDRFKITITYYKSNNIVDSIIDIGDYIIIYSITDQDNNKSEIKRLVTIIDYNSVLNRIDINNPTNYLSEYGVSVSYEYYDSYNNKIQKIDKDGAYKVVYTFTDLYGNTRVESSNITYNMPKKDDKNYYRYVIITPIFILVLFYIKISLKKK